MDDSEREWRALHSQVIKVNSENEANRKEFQTVTNTIKEAIVRNNIKFSEDYKRTHAHIDHYCNDNTLLKCLLNGGSAYGPYDVNRIPLISDPMPAALLSDPMIRIPLS